ncbi:MAG: hypothetical protein FWG48_04300 [Oscillospiraceae bacterium]|nr:hypothetical protein [Oscillospiraceae bacterium]
MANLDDFRKRAKEALNTIADVSVEMYKSAEEKARIMTRRAKLNADISRDKSLIRRRFIDIGKTYYELNKDMPGEEFEQSCDDITAAYASIEALKEEVKLLKTHGLNYDAADAKYKAAPQDEESQDEAPQDEDSNQD